MNRRFPICLARALGTVIVGMIFPIVADGRDFNGFDLTRVLVPVAEIRSGGPPRDGIPSIDHPRFIEASAVRFLNPDDLVVSVTVGVETRAYPLRILVWHEIVNDTFGDVPLAITYCPLCGTSMVFDRRYEGSVLSFGVSGLLYQSDVLMYDRETESLWSQLGLKSVAGKFSGTPLTWIASEHMTWKAWRERYPHGDVLATDTGHRRDYSGTPYEGYEETDRTYFPVPLHRKDLKNKEWVAGIVVGGQSKAYRLHTLPDGEFVEDEIAGVKIRVRYEHEKRFFQAERRDTNERLPYVVAYWFAWQAFYPDTQLSR